MAYLGPAGTFSEEALRGEPAAAGAQAVPFASIHDAVAAVQGGAVDRALVPIENALEGGVSATLDALAAEAPDVVVVGERVLAIRTCLLAREAIAFEAITLVVSHPQPLAQCARFLRAALPGAALRAATSTAEAVREVVAARESWAALAPLGAAERYGASVLREGIDDEPGNATRFVWLARSGAPPVAAADDAAWKTSVLFAGAGDAQPGWLVRCLSEFAFRGVNLTRIESRPQRARLGHYVFHVDLEGRAAEPTVAAAIVGLRAHCDEVRLLGSYPAASGR